MKKTRSMTLQIGFYAAFVLCTLCRAQNNKVTLQNPDSVVTISKHIYGHFAEHLGRCIYDGLYVKEGNVKIPNNKGVRNDVMEALKKMKIPNLRWPGGCFADAYQWKDGIGPKANRPKMVNVWWGGVTEDNSFGTHEFLDMCEQLGAEPYLAANVGSGTVKDFADWVQYVNFEGESPMSDLRRKNGREKPWNVKLWGVGNEAWGCGGNMSPDYYANLYKQYSTFMKSNHLYRIASGASSNDYNWTEVLMKNIPQGLIEGIALHHYSVIDWNAKGPATGFSEEQYFSTLKNALQMEELITNHSKIMDKYDPKRKVGLVVDEWGGWYEVEKGSNPGFLYQQNTMRDAMIAGVTLNIFNNHADRVKIANLAQIVNVLQAVILTNAEKMLLTPTYHVMEMFNVHQEARLIPISIESNDYTLHQEKLKAISGSASKDSLGNTHITLVNIDSKQPQDVTIHLPSHPNKSVTGRVLTSDKIDDHNTFDNIDKIKPSVFKDFKISKGSISLKLPPFSVVVLKLN